MNYFQCILFSFINIVFSTFRVFDVNNKPNIYLYCFCTAALKCQISEARVDSTLFQNSLINIYLMTLSTLITFFGNFAVCGYDYVKKAELVQPGKVNRVLLLAYPFAVDIKVNELKLKRSFVILLRR